jgi:hypothetical protein
MFLSVETNCFDEKWFSTISESLEWFGALFEFLKNFLWSPLGHPRYAVVPFAFYQKILKPVFISRNYTVSVNLNPGYS